MVNTLITQMILPEPTKEQINMFSQLVSWVTPLPETREVDGRVTVQAIGSKNNLEMIKLSLELIGKAPIIVGVWDVETGLQEGYEKINIGTNESPVYTIQRKKDLMGNDVVIEYPFNITEYTKHLSDIKTYDSNGNIVSSVRPTEEQARGIQINKFSGMPDRDLTTY